MPIQKLKRSILEAAIVGFEFQKNDLDNQIAEVRAMLDGGSAATAATPEAPTGKRKISAAARRRMALGQKARWAKIKGESEAPAPAATPKPLKAKRKLSKAGRAAIVAATKARWNRVRAEAAAKTKPAAKKKTAAKKTAAKKAAPARATKKTPAKKAAVKKTAPAAAQATEAGNQ